MNMNHMKAMQATSATILDLLEKLAGESFTHLSY